MTDTDIRITPTWLRDRVREFAGNRPLLDVCTQPDNPMKADIAYTVYDDGLSRPWLQCNTSYCNPPYSRGNVIKWAHKAVREATMYAEVIMLTQADVSTEWYQYIASNADVRCHLHRRVQFLEPVEGGGYAPCVGGAKFGSQLAYWGRRRRRFADMFGASGEILHGLGPLEK